MRELTRKPNGFGSCTAEVAIVISKPYHKHLENSDWDYEILDETEFTQTVLYEIDNQYAGDDETIVHALWGDFPEEIIEGGHFKIDWDNSGY